MKPERVTIPENQKLWMYVDGECIVETNVVTGNINNGNGTRKGVFSLTYKTRNAVLRGPGYESPVSYWMPFDGDIGLHDATWRSSFGGTIYKYNGSHGCVNMPFNAAKTVYENLILFQRFIKALFYLNIVRSDFFSLGFGNIESKNTVVVFGFDILFLYALSDVITPRTGITPLSADIVLLVLFLFIAFSLYGNVAVIERNFYVL